MSDDAAGMPGTETVELAQAKNHEAFSQLYEYYKLFIYRYLASLVGDLEYAFDLTQETFIRAWINLPDLRTPSHFKPWLFCIARNLAIDHKRSSRREAYPLLLEELEKRHDMVASHPNPEDIVMEQDLVRYALSKLPNHYRDCLLLQQAGFTHQEIAELIGLTKGSVSTYVSNARRKFIEVYCHFDTLRKRR